MGSLDQISAARRGKPSTGGGGGGTLDQISAHRSGGGSGLPAGLSDASGIPLDPSAPPAKPHKGGGLLGAIEHGASAVGHAAGAVADKTANVTASIGTGLYEIGKNEGQAISDDLHGRNKAVNNREWHDLFHGHLVRMFHEADKGDATPAARANADFERTTIGSSVKSVTSPSYVKQHPLTAVLNDLALVSGGATTAAKIAYLAKVARAARVAQTGELIDLGSQAAKDAEAAGHTVTPLSATEKASLAAKTLSPTHRVPQAERTLQVPKLVAPEGEGPARLTHEPVQIGTGSQTPLMRGAQALHDKVAQKALDNGVSAAKQTRLAKYAEKRGAGGVGESARVTQNVRAADVAKVSHAMRDLDKGVPSRLGELSSFLRSANVTGKEAADYWGKQAAAGVGDRIKIGKGAGQLRTAYLAKLAQAVHDRGLIKLGDDGNVTVDAARYPKLHAADQTIKMGQDSRAEIIADRDLMSPEQMQERLDLVGRKMAGAHYEAPTPGKLGVPSQALLKARSRVERLQTLHDRVSAKAAEGNFSAAQKKILGDLRPASDEEAVIQAKLDAANKQVAALRKKLPADSEEVQAKVREKTAWQKLQIARGDMEKAATGLKGATVPSPDEIAARIETLRGEVAAARGTRDPELVKALNRAQATANKLRTARKATEKGSRLDSAGVAYTSTGKRLEPIGYARAQKLGAALSVAKDELQRLEQQHIARQKPVGIVGGDGARHGQGFVSLRTAITRSPQSGVARARGPVIGLTKRLNVGKTATGKGVEKGLVPASTTKAVARGLHEALRFVNSDDIRGRVAKLGSDVKRTGDDILLADPAAEKHAATLSPRTQQILGRSESTVTEPGEDNLRLAGRERLQQLIPGLRDEFAANKAAAVGERAPTGYKWVPKQLVPDQLTSSVAARGRIEKFADAVNSAVTSATVYLKLGHLPTRVLTNLSTNAVQGSLSPGELVHNVTLAHALTDGQKTDLLAATGTHGYQALPHAGTGAIAKIASKGANMWARRIDAPFRLNAIIHELRQVGIDTPEKIDKAIVQLKDPSRSGMSASEISKLDGAVRRANRASIMYDGMSAAEQRNVARYMWFWPWTKGAARFAGHTVAEHPAKAAAGAAIGQEGASYRQKMLGNGPSYEFGLTPYTGGKNPLTGTIASFTPYSTSGDLAEMIAHPFSKDSGVLGQANPYYSAITTLIADSLSGKKNPLGDAFQMAVQPTPEAQIVNAALHPPGPNKMFQPTPLGVHDPRLAAALSALLRGAAGAAVPRPTNLSALHKTARR